MTPIPHQFQGNCKHGEHLNSGRAHAIVRVLSCLDVERARSVTVSEDSISGIAQRQGQKGSAHLDRRVGCESVCLATALSMLTSVVMPAMMICFLPVASTAALNAGLSQAFTSP